MTKVSIPTTQAFLVASFYRFYSLTQVTDFKLELDDICQKEEMLGTIILASEGINGTIAGSQKGVHNILQFLWAKESLKSLIPKFSIATKPIFKSMRIRIREEIVAMKQDGLDPSKETGCFVRPEDWDNFIADPDTLVIDTRNFYEHALGSFKGSIKADTQYFREFPEWIEKNYKDARSKRIAMFCTGGVRCEKASSYLLKKGFDKVFQLEGGILKYLEVVEKKTNNWTGDCFVFDQRVSLNKDLKEGEFYIDPDNRVPQKKIKTND